MTSPPVSPDRPPPVPSLLALTSGRVAPGIWTIGSVPNDAIAQAHNVGWQSIELDLYQPNDKQSLLVNLANAADFPDYFGQNWDAAADCLADLSWLPGSGYLVIVRGGEDFRSRHNTLDEILVDVLLEAVDYWASQGVPFHVLWETPDQSALNPHRFNPVPGPRTDIASVSPWPIPST